MSLLHKIPPEYVEPELPEYFWDIAAGVLNLNSRHNTFRFDPESGTVWLWEVITWTSNTGHTWTNLGYTETSWWADVGRRLRMMHGDFDHSQTFISFGTVTPDVGPEIVGPREGIQDYRWWE